MTQLAFTPLTMTALTFVMSALFAFGGILLKQAVAAGQPLMVAAAYVAFMIGNLLYLMLIAVNGLAVAATLSSLASMLVTVLAARFYFGEILNSQQIAGFGLAIVAVALISLPPIFGR